MNTRQMVACLATVAAVCVVAVHASEADPVTVQGASGHPYINAAISNYSISDGTVSFKSPYTWIAPIPVNNVTGPSCSGYTTYTVVANGAAGGSGAGYQAWSFSPGGTAYSGVGLNNSVATPDTWAHSITIPCGGTLFVKVIGGTASTTLASASRIP